MRDMTLEDVTRRKNAARRNLQAEAQARLTREQHHCRKRIRDSFRISRLRIAEARSRASLSVNRELILLYWHIGREIVQRQKREGWGTKVIERLARDLHLEFPEMKGFTRRNLLFMRSLAESYEDTQIVKQLVSQIPWGHNIRIIQAVKDRTERLWYVRKTIEHGWSRNILALQIKSGLYHRQGKPVTNFSRTLPAPQSDLAQEALKDPYVFDFLSLSQEAHEREVEKELVKHITRFLLELGAGFAFVGEQYRLEVSQQDFFIDLLFYHTRLHCYIAIELKAGDFKPEYAGKINFYLSALDDMLRTPNDNPSIGLILCATKDKVIAEYALRDMTKPIGVSQYTLTRAIPKNLRTSLPSIEELETELTAAEKTQDDKK
jgi:predicted nuclease of restriction endonuclease-like (RecB) superfamily